MAGVIKYYSWRKNQENGIAPIDWSAAGDTIKVMLVSSSYTPSTAHEYKDDITNEVSGTNYTARGSEITSRSVTESAGVTTIDGADVTWTQSGSGFSNARYAIIYKDTAVDATSPLVGYIDFTADKGNVTGDLTVQWNAAGIFTSS